MTRPAGRCREWTDVYASPSLSPWRPEGGRFSITQIQTHLSLSTQANILIDQDCHARVADFGLSTITGLKTHSAPRNPDTAALPPFSPPTDSLASFNNGLTTRWASPDILDPTRFGVPEAEGDRPTRQSDCYAMGMVIYEVGSSADDPLTWVINLHPGVVWTLPVPQPRAGRYNHEGNSRWGATEETRERTTPWVH